MRKAMPLVFAIAMSLFATACGDDGQPAFPPRAEEPPGEDPPVEEPPGEDPPVEEPPGEEPPAEDPRPDEPAVVELSATLDCPSEVASGTSFQCSVTLTGYDRWTIGWAGADNLGPEGEIWGQHTETTEPSTTAGLSTDATILAPELADDTPAAVVLRAWGPPGSSNLTHDGVSAASDLVDVRIVAP